VLFGGRSSAAALADTWEWDGSQWSPRATTAVPAARSSAALAYDPNRARVLLFGGGGQLVLPADTWQLGPFVTAAATVTGVACLGTLGLPVLTSGEPYLGHLGFALDLAGARPSAPCVFGFAAAPANLAVGGGCTLYLAQPIVALTATANGAGFASLPLPVPADARLYGLELHAQGFVIDPQGAAFGLAFSAGRKLRIGE
jgi:hypothetical protein